MTQRVYLSMGSNLGDRESNLRTATRLLGEEVTIQEVSAIVQTAPVGVTDQPSFLNLAVGGSTDLTPRQLLSVVKRIEREVGRTPTFRWGPRVLDIDILFYGDTIIQDHDLIVPHPEIAHRAFVLVPLADIAPQLVHPTLGITVQELRDAAPGLGTVRPWAP